MARSSNFISEIGQFSSINHVYLHVRDGWELFEVHENEDVDLPHKNDLRLLTYNVICFTTACIIF